MAKYTLYGKVAFPGYVTIEADNLVDLMRKVRAMDDPMNSGFTVQSVRLDQPTFDWPGDLFDERGKSISLPDDGIQPPITCRRCGSDIEDGRCMDECCPFSNFDQNDPRGWEGHPSPPAR